MAKVPCIQWGTITLDLDNATFRKAFTQGRSMYFDDCEYDHPQLVSCMSTLDVVRSVLEDDGKGSYRFDRMAFKNPIDILGFFLGYMSGPLMAESREECEERMQQMVLLPEPATTESTAL